MDIFKRILNARPGQVIPNWPVDVVLPTATSHALAIERMDAALVELERAFQEFRKEFSQPEESKA